MCREKPCLVSAHQGGKYGLKCINCHTFMEG